MTEDKAIFGGLNVINDITQVSKPRKMFKNKFPFDGAINLNHLICSANVKNAFNPEIR